MVLRTPDRAGKLAGDMRLAAPCFGRRDPLKRQVELLLEDKVMMEPRLIIGGGSHNQRALGSQFDVDAGYGLKFGRKSGPTRLALASKRNQCLLAGFRLATGGKHAGGRMGRSGPSQTAIIDRNI